MTISCASNKDLLIELKQRLSTPIEVEILIEGMTAIRNLLGGRVAPMPGDNPAELAHDIAQALHNAGDLHNSVHEEITRKRLYELQTKWSALDKILPHTLAWANRHE